MDTGLPRVIRVRELQSSNRQTKVLALVTSKIIYFKERSLMSPLARMKRAAQNYATNNVLSSNC